MIFIPVEHQPGGAVEGGRGGVGGCWGGSGQGNEERGAGNQWRSGKTGNMG